MKVALVPSCPGNRAADRRSLATRILASPQHFVLRETSAQSAKSSVEVMNVLGDVSDESAVAKMADS